MKTLLLLLAIGIATAFAPAQPREGKKLEMTLSGSYQNYSSGSESQSTGAFLLSPRVGFFVVGGLEIEPEVIALFASGADPVYNLNGLLSYNFPAVGNAAPFVVIGYGIANTVPFFHVPLTKMDFTVDVLNIGGGVKVFVTEDVALRLEYRYQGFSGQGSTVAYGFFSYTEKVDMRIHTVEFGFSVLL